MDEREHSDDDANDAGPNRQNQDRQQAVDRQQNQQRRNAGRDNGPGHADPAGSASDGVGDRDSASTDQDVSDPR